jgi:hypothetical protein
MTQQIKLLHLSRFWVSPHFYESISLDKFSKIKKNYFLLLSASKWGLKIFFLLILFFTQISVCQSYNLSLHGNFAHAENGWVYGFNHDYWIGCWQAHGNKGGGVVDCKNLKWNFTYFFRAYRFLYSLSLFL